MENELLWIVVFVALVATAIAMAIIAVRRNGRGVDRILKQLIVWTAIAALLPLTSYAGATLLHPRTRLKDLMEQSQRAQSETYDTRDVNLRTKGRDKQEALNKQVATEQRLFNRAMFWIGFPVGLTCLIAGLLLRSTVVGSSLALGGLCTLISGCYTYWDDMGDALRFISLIITLVIVIAIGLLKFGRPYRDEDLVTARVA